MTLRAALPPRTERRLRGPPDLQRRVDPGQKCGPFRAEIADDGCGLLGTRQQRLPAVQVLEAVEVAARHRRESSFGDPPIEVIAIEELPPVDVRAELTPVASE